MYVLAQHQQDFIFIITEVDVVVLVKQRVLEWDEGELSQGVLLTAGMLGDVLMQHPVDAKFQFF